MDHNLFEPYLLPQSLVIKDEQDCGSPLLSPPATPSLSSPLTLPSLPTTSPRRNSFASSVASPKRQRPYPTIKTFNSPPQEELSTMSSNGAAYGSYTHGSTRSHGRSHPSGERRSSDGENQNAYAQSSQYMPVSPNAQTSPKPCLYSRRRTRTWFLAHSVALWATRTWHTLDNQGLPPRHTAEAAMPATYPKTKR